MGFINIRKAQCIGTAFFVESNRLGGNKIRKRRFVIVFDLCILFSIYLIAFLIYHEKIDDNADITNNIQKNIIKSDLLESEQIQRELNKSTTDSDSISKNTKDKNIKDKKINYEQKIKVALMKDDFSSVYHNKIQLTCKSAFAVRKSNSDTSSEKIYQANQILQWNQNDMSLGTKLEIIPDNYISDNQMDVMNNQIVRAQKDGICLLSFTRSYGTPSYPGTITLYFTEDGILVVNELPLETYLCLVVPSELPAESELEALKAQAVCARSYAYKQLQSDGIADGKADLTDSTTNQVYNNQRTTNQVCTAVSETAGEILEDTAGKVVDTYYYSTSWGYSSDTSVWGYTNDICTMHLDGEIIQNSDRSGEAVSTNMLPDVQTEDGFRKFYNNWDIYVSTLYDAQAPWFRWRLDIDKQDIQNVLTDKFKLEKDNKIDTKYLCYRTKEGVQLKSYKEMVDVMKKEQLADIKITERGSGGAVNTICLTYNTGDYLEIYTSGRIRELLGSDTWKIKRNDGTVFEGWSILPSAFFYIKINQNICQIYGGGFGHGAGMSQNAACAMAADGINYAEILQFFYNNVEVEELY